MENKLKKKKRMHFYYLQNKEKIIKKSKIYAKDHPEIRKKIKKKYRLKHKEEIRKYYLKNKEKIRVYYHLKYSKESKDPTVLLKRSQTLTTYINGKIVHLHGINKRIKPLRCERCKKIVKKLAYHHWNPQKPEMGIWLCYGCHMFAERVEKHKSSSKKAKSYFKLKKEIETKYLKQT